MSELNLKMLDLIRTKMSELDLNKLDLILAGFGLITVVWTLYIVLLQIRQSKRHERKDIRNILGSASHAIKSRSRSEG